MVPQTGIERVVVTNVFDLIEAQPAPDGALPGRVTAARGAGRRGPSYLPDPSTGLNDIALLQYTGGTTGPAKGAVLTHGNLLASSRQSGTLVEVDPDQPDIVIAPMPLYHIYGFTMNIIGTFLCWWSVCIDSGSAGHRWHDRDHEGLPLYRFGRG